MAIPNDHRRWDDEDEFWREHYSERPYYSTRGGDYDFYQPGYRYGYEAAGRYPDRDWADVEPDLARDWDEYEYRGESTWEQIKDAVRDAWDRVTGRRHVETR
jgi:hypothetical protein